MGMYSYTPAIDIYDCFSQCGDGITADDEDCDDGDFIIFGHLINGDG